MNKDAVSWQPGKSLHPAAFSKKKLFSGVHHGKPPCPALRWAHLTNSRQAHLHQPSRFPRAPTLAHEGAFGWVCTNSGRVLLGHLLLLCQASEVWGTKVALLPAEGTQRPSLLWFHCFWNKIFVLSCSFFEPASPSPATMSFWQGVAQRSS